MYLLVLHELFRVRCFLLLFLNIFNVSKNVCRRQERTEKSWQFCSQESECMYKHWKLTNVKPHRIPRLKSPIILCFEQRNGGGVWGEVWHEIRVGKQFWQRISERGKRRDRMEADQYGGYLPDQLWSLPHDRGRSTTITVRAFCFLTTV